MRSLKVCSKNHAQPELPAWGALGTQLVTGLFAAADNADSVSHRVFKRTLKETLKNPSHSKLTIDPAMVLSWYSHGSCGFTEPQWEAISIIYINGKAALPQTHNC